MLLTLMLLALERSAPTFADGGEPRPAMVQDEVQEEAQAEREPQPESSTCERMRVVLEHEYTEQFTPRRRSEDELERMRELFELAQQFHADPIARFVTLEAALAAAIGGRGAEEAIDCIARLDRAFEGCDTLALEIDALAKIADDGRRAIFESLFDAALPRLGMCLEQERAALAERLLLALGKFHGTRGVRSHPSSETFGSALDTYTEALALLHAATAARARLRETPDDPAANLELGRYLAFVCKRFDAALDHLSKGADEALAICAREDLAAPQAAAAQRRLGDLWWTWASTQEEKSAEERISGGVDGARERSRHWYRLALDRLDESERIALADRLAPVADPAAVADPPEPDDVEDASPPPVSSTWQLARIDRQEARAKYQGRGTSDALERGLAWLAGHQDEDGKWDADQFMQHDPAGDRCDGAGHMGQDVGLTGLALLAFLGDGSTTNDGAYKHVVASGIEWLRGQQNADTGLFGKSASHDFLYGHAIATIAMCEAYCFSREPLVKVAAESAIKYILRARNPNGAWRYEVPPIGDNDMSVTGWMVVALASAKEAGLEIDPAALAGALALIDAFTDPATGRCGYDSTGSLSSRLIENNHFPREKGEAMTAVALLCRFFLDQDPSKSQIMRGHADLLQRTLPEWDTDLGCDMYYWYYGTYAMFQMGGTHWQNWNKAMKMTVVDSQRRDGSSKGSWDPVGPWGFLGGRVYSTAMMVLCLEVYYRYAQVADAR